MKAEKKVIYYCKQGEPYCVSPNCTCNTINPEHTQQETGEVQVVKDSLTTQTVEKWEDFELYDVFETAIQESALTVVTKYHNLDEETTELALECVRIFKELKGTTYQNKEDETIPS